MKTLINVDGLFGFTLGKEYKLISKSGKEFFTVLNDNGVKSKLKQVRFK